MDKAKPQTQKIKVKTEGPIGLPKKDKKQSIKSKNNRSLSFHFDFWVGLFVALSIFCFFRIFGCSLISYELLDKTYIYAHHENDLNEGLK